MEDAPHRTLPTIGLDLNDGLGRWKGRQIESDALSVGCTREEGFAGKLFREMLERQRLYVASGHFRELPTFHGTHGNTSTIDFVVLPQSYAEFVRAATVLGKSGRQLQHARVRRPLDHDPVMIRFEYAPDFRPAKRERPPLDMDLGLSMTTGYRRAEFLARVERETEEVLRQHPPHATMTTGGKMWWGYSRDRQRSSSPKDHSKSRWTGTRS